MKLEELFVKLIEKGWRIENFGARISDVKYMYGLRELWIVYESRNTAWEGIRKYSIRQLVSRESNLWSFACSNGLTPKDERVSWRKIDEDGNYINHYAKYREKGSEEEYRLIESALKREGELEDFLLANIKIDEI